MFYLIYNQINKTHPQRTNTLVSLWDGSSPGHRAERILIHHSKRLSEHTHTHTHTHSCCKERNDEVQVDSKSPLKIKTWWIVCVCCSVSHYCNIPGVLLEQFDRETSQLDY